MYEPAYTDPPLITHTSWETPSMTFYYSHPFTIWLLVSLSEGLGLSDARCMKSIPPNLGHDLKTPVQSPLSLMHEHGWWTAKQLGVDYFLTYPLQFFEVVVLRRSGYLVCRHMKDFKDFIIILQIVMMWITWGLKVHIPSQSALWVLIRHSHKLPNLPWSPEPVDFKLLYNYASLLWQQKVSPHQHR